MLAFLKQVGLRRVSAGPACVRRFLLPEFKHRSSTSKGIQVGSMMKIYVGNLSFNTSESQLRELFEQHGAVTSASLVMDRDTGRPRGFGFVEMSDNNEAQAAIKALNGQNLDGRDLTVNEAKPREGGGGRGGFGGGGNRGGGGKRW
jgi:cold-inducible RNA-binding protein